MLVASVPNVASLAYRLSWAVGRVPSCAASGNLPAALGGTGYERAGGAVVGGHVVDFTRSRFVGLLRHCGFDPVRIRGTGLFWHRRILPPWAVPASLASDIVCVAVKRP